MRALLLVTGVLTILMPGCSAAGPDDYLAQDGAAVDDRGMRKQDVVNAVATAAACVGCSGSCDCGGPSATAPAPICFMIPSGVADELPGIQTAAERAAAGWGRTFSSEDCPNWFAIVDDLPDGRMASRGVMSGGSNVIRFRKDAIAYLSMTEESCGPVTVDGSTTWQTPLVQILLHEFGHVLGYRGDDPDDPKHSLDGLMSARHDSGCAIVWPTADDIAATRQ